MSSLQLDAKQSPLALLAQTCNSIGKDSPSSKSIIPPLDKKDVQKERESGKGSPALKSEKTSSGGNKREGSLSPGQRDAAEDRKRIHHSPSPGQVRASSVGHKSSLSPAPHGRETGDGSSSRRSSSPANNNNDIKTSSSSPSLYTNSKMSPNCARASEEVKHTESMSASPLARSSAPAPPPAHTSYADTIAQATSLHSLPGSYHGLPMLGHMGHLDPATSAAASAYYASLSPTHNAHALGLAAAHAQKGAAGLSPYLQYTSVKTASGTTLVPMCKDPYCTQCQLTMRSAHLGSGSCPPGCAQCPASAAATAAAASASSPHNFLSSMYPQHPFSVLPGQHSLPYVCNWLQGSDYCGKRFANSEELLHHLRSHTSDAAQAAALPTALPYPNLGLTTAAAHGLHLPYPTQGSISPSSLGRHGYPSSLSPNGLSALAASRFHPYKSPLSSLSTPSQLPSHLTPYYQYLPYSLYGQRLGAAMTP